MFTEEYLPSTAREDGYFVIEDGIVIEGNHNAWSSFCLDSQMQKNAQVGIIVYEQGNILEMRKITYDSEKQQYQMFVMTSNSQNKKDDSWYVQIVEEYEYMFLFDHTYVFTNKKTLTEEDWKENFQEDMPGGVRTIFSY